VAKAPSLSAAFSARLKVVPFPVLMLIKKSEPLRVP
jgi:hypothetical protein